MASLVQGEDSESSEDEINTDMLPSHPKGTIMTGEEEEDEDEGMSFVFYKLIILNIL